MLYNIFFLLIYFVYSSLYLLIPFTYFAPPTIFVLVCVGCYNKNTTHSVAYKQQNFFSQLWKWTSKLRVLAWWREGPLLGCGLPAVSSRDGRHKGSSLL